VTFCIFKQIFIKGKNKRIPFHKQQFNGTNKKIPFSMQGCKASPLLYDIEPINKNKPGVKQTWHVMKQA